MSITITLPHISTFITTLRTTTESIKAITSSRSFQIVKKVTIVGASAYFVYTCYTKAKSIHDATLLHREEAKRARELEESRRREQQRQIESDREEQLRLTRIENLWNKARIFALREARKRMAARLAHQVVARIQFFRKLRKDKGEQHAQAVHRAWQSAKANSSLSSVSGRLFASIRRETQIWRDDLCKAEIKKAICQRGQIQKKREAYIARLHALRDYIRRVRVFYFEKKLVSHAQAKEEVLEASTKYACIRTIFLISKEKGSFTMTKVKEVKKACRNHSICLALIKVKQEEMWFRAFESKPKAEGVVRKAEKSQSQRNTTPKAESEEKVVTASIAIPAGASRTNISTTSPLMFLKPELMAKKYSLPSDWSTSGAFVVMEEEAVMEILLREYRYYRTNKMAHPGAGDHHPGVKKLDHVQYLELQSELAVLRNHKVIPYEFMAQPGWSGERRDNVNRQISFCRMKAKLQAQGKWVEPTPEEKAAKALLIPSLQRNKEKGKSRASFPKPTAVVKPPVNPKTIENTAKEIGEAKPVPPVMDPPMVTSFVDIQEEQLEEMLKENGKVVLKPTQLPASS